MTRTLRLFSFLLLALTAFLFAGTPGTAAASERDIYFASGTLSREVPGEPSGLYLNADFSLNLPTQVLESLNRGVALHFVAEFRLTKPRWYWKDKTVASVKLTRRLTYSLLTRKYHLGSSGLSQSFTSADDALHTLGTLRRWRVADSDAISGDFRDYQAELVFYLDTARLPRPLQLGAGDWDLTSDWVQIPVSPALGAI